MKKKLFVTILLLSACLIALSACGKKDETAETASEVIQQETKEKTKGKDNKKTETDENKPEENEYESSILHETATDESIEEKMLELWREDLPKAGGNQAVYDDKENNAVIYYPNGFELKKSASSDGSAKYVNKTDGAEFTVTIEENEDEYTLEEFAKNTAETELVPEYDLKYTGSHGFQLTGAYPEDKECVKINGFLKNGKLYTLKLTYPEELAEKYDMPENEVFMLVYNLDRNRNEVFDFK